MFAFLLPKIVIEMAYLTAEAFCSRGSSVASIAESAKSRQIGELSRPSQTTLNNCIRLGLP